MTAKEKKLERQIEIWTLLGPFIMVMTLCVILIKPTHHQLFIPLAALIGIPICWKWKLPGLAVSLGILAALMAYQFIYASHAFIFWDFTLGIAVALTFAVTALSFKEVEAVLTIFQTESSARLQSFLKADEKIKALENQHESDLTIQNSKIKILQDNLSEKTRQLQSYETIVNVAREELLQTLRQNEALQQEVFNARHELALLEQKHQEATDLPQLEPQIRELNERMAKLALEKEAADNALGHLQKELESLKALDAEKDLKIQSYDDLIQKTKESAALSEQELIQYRQKSEELVEACTSKESALTEELRQAREDKSNADKALQILQHQLTSQPEAAPQDVQSFNRMEGMYNQLREQFDEKCQTLDDSRRELFLVQEELLKLQRENEEEKKFSLNESEVLLGRLLARADQELSEAAQEYRQENEALFELVQNLLTPKEQPNMELMARPIQEFPEEDTKTKKSAPKKKKSQKPTKTTDWANTILSRWSE